MLFKKSENDPDKFWREYEEKIGEKVLARSLGQYHSGWEEFDSQKGAGMWGLVMATTGGFRFHHFPQSSWLEALTRFTGSAEPKEKTIFIPKEQIVSAVLIKETMWLKKIFMPTSPRLIIHYQDAAGNKRELIMETDSKSGDLAERLNN